MNTTDTMRTAALLVALSGLAGAQNGLIWTTSGDGSRTATAGNGNLAVGVTNNEGLQYVVPSAVAPYSTNPFFPAGAFYVWLGDANNDGTIIRTTGTGPWGTLDAVFVKRFMAPPVTGPRQVYHSFAAPSSTQVTPPVLDGDILRFPANYGVELFLSEATAVLAANGDGDLDINAICQDPAGGLYLSFADSESVNGVTYADGSLFYLAPTDITYDASGNVSTVVAGALQVVATETDIDAMVVAAGARDAHGAQITAISDLASLDLDPNGGVFTAPRNSNLVLPNLVFGSDSSSVDFALFSTRGGGSLAVINGVTMGSTTATTSAHMGMTPDPDGGDGLTGLAVIPAIPQPFVVKHAANGLSTSGPLWFRSEVAGATPGTAVAWFLGIPDLPDRFSMVVVPGFGELFAAGAPLLQVGVAMADADGYAGLPVSIPPAVVGTGETVWQAVDLTASKLAIPAVFDF